VSDRSNPFAPVVDELSPDDNSVTARLVRAEKRLADFEARLGRLESPPLLLAGPEAE
jgi:hypothetical protein